jgi:hypothetical protein
MSSVALRRLQQGFKLWRMDNLVVFYSQPMKDGIVVT